MSNKFFNNKVNTPFFYKFTQENNLMMRLFTLSLFLLLNSIILAQNQPSNGVAKSIVSSYFLLHVNLFVSPTEILENVSVLIENEKIKDFGKLLLTPSDAVVIDMNGKTIVPSFIELYSNIGLPAPISHNSNRPQLNTLNKGDYYWNEAIHPEVEAATLFHVDPTASESLIKMGFGFALSHQQDGIARGTAALVSIGDVPISKAIISPLSANFYSFSKGTSNQSYPSSQMGSIALLRQAFYDRIYAQQTNNFSLSMKSWTDHLALPNFFKVEDKWEIIRASKIAKEFDLPMNFIGSGNEYANVTYLKDIKAQLVVPINFPDAYDVQDPYVAKQIPLSELKHWELAPFNTKILLDNEVRFAITSNGITAPDVFWKNIRKQVELGVSTASILNSLTLVPASYLEIDALVGSLNKGKLASFCVYNLNPFENEALLLESWHLGERTVLNSEQKNNVLGKFSLTLNGKKYLLQLLDDKEKPTGQLIEYIKKYDPKTKLTTTDTLTNKVLVRLNQDDISMSFNLDDQKDKGSYQLHGRISAEGGVMEGDALIADGTWVLWAAIRQEKPSQKEKTNKEVTTELTTPSVWLPNMAFGTLSKSSDKPIVIKNAQIWTNESEQILTDAMVICSAGKIVYVGKDNQAYPPNALVIDAKNQHLTSGIIDEHSHIAISKGVNEGGESVTAEVSIGDVVNPDDINIYRQLSGGVTAAQLLHGSANTIGGQSALIKLKWGASPSEMLITNAPKFIKCALGENVKQANWGDFNTVRFPQTRMGVEQVFYDGFNRALIYQEKIEKFKQGKIPAIRKDLELDVLSEILSGERKITCHSYVQSEINMLMKVADSMHFTVNTFTHILEGYKVADKMKEHGVGASTFSDWWAYKFEVNDAIPYNASLMSQQGLVVAINSDDAEMGRRLNQEAAKSVKYGGMSEIEAWKMVTLNPAKLLHLDDRMGSIKVGKDADLVLWSDNPLSINAKVNYTIIDGEIKYSATEDIAAQERNRLERARITALMLKSNKSSAPGKKYEKKKKQEFHCNTLGEEGTDSENTH